MNGEPTKPGTGPSTCQGALFWAGLVIVALSAALVLLLGLLAVSIMEHRWEAQRPAIVLQPVAALEPNSAIWGGNYPQEYDSYLKTRITDGRTKFGGAFPRDYLDEDPLKVILWAGSAFSVDYLQARGHYYSVEDILRSKRVKKPRQPATCWTCKSADVPRTIAKMGRKAFYAADFHDLSAEMTHPVGCLDCHDPATMKLRISRPALVEAFAAMGKDINEATGQQMRSLVCAQCHAEYYFRNDEQAGLKNYLVLPWRNGTGVDEILAYYEEIEFSDFTHPVSGAAMLKAQHPDYEMFVTGAHAGHDISCADCHMPYRSQGGMKFTDHHVQSPLLNVSNSCAVCHRWGEDEIRARVEAIQAGVKETTMAAERALAAAHFDVAAAMQAGAADDDLVEARRLLRQGQFRWDFVCSNNGTGFHSPQQSLRILAQAIDQAQQARIIAARLLGGRGISGGVNYPDIMTRQKAAQVADNFAQNSPPDLLP